MGSIANSLSGMNLGSLDNPASNLLNPSSGNPSMGPPITPGVSGNPMIVPPQGNGMGMGNNFMPNMMGMGGQGNNMMPNMLRTGGMMPMMGAK